MKIVLHTLLDQDECRSRFAQQTVPAPSWWQETLGHGFETFRRLEEAPVVCVFRGERIDLGIRECWSRSHRWPVRLDPDAERGGTRITLRAPGSENKWGNIAFFAIVAVLILGAVLLPAKPPAHDVTSVFWGVVFPPLFFGLALALIVVLAVRQMRREARVLKSFVMRILEATEIGD